MRRAASADLWRRCAAASALGESPMATPEPAILEVAGLRKAFGGIVAVDDVAFAIDKPGIYGLIGPNGAGKTTLFDVICGRQMADTGTIRFEGRPIEALHVH